MKEHMEGWVCLGLNLNTRAYLETERRGQQVQGW